MKINFCVIIVIFFRLNLYPQDSSFIFKTASFENYTPASLGNGYFTIESSQISTKAASSYMAWIYDHADGDVARIARLPAWNEINYFDGQKWLNDVQLDKSSITSYEQTLNMFYGTLNTNYNWNDNGEITSIENEIFISRDNKNLSAIKFKIKPGFDGEVKISLPLKEWNAPERKRYGELKKIAPNPPGSYPAEWYPGFMKVQSSGIDTSSGKVILWMISKPEGKDVSVSEAVTIDWIPKLKNQNLKFINNKNETALEVQFNAEKNQTYTFYKYISAVSSNELKNPLAKAKQIVMNAGTDGYEKVLEENNKAWTQLWETDIILEGDPQLQKIVHSMMFYLFCSIRAGTNFSIPPMGLVNDGYYGHIFWDADTFMFPALLLMHPELAKSMVNFRFKTLDAARKNAVINGYKGAMYPWESDEIGNEATPMFAYQNALHENHITADVAIAQWQYYSATRDKNWLADTGYNVIKQTADFWVSRSIYNNQKDRYEIRDIVSVDEGRVGIDNDTYTNSVAKKNLEIAVKAAGLLNKPVNPDWKTVGEKLFIPFDSLKQIYPTYENAPDSILGSVVTMLIYPLDVKMSEAAKVNNFDNAAKLIIKEGPGAMMNLLPIAAAEVMNEKFFNQLSEISYKPYLHPPFNVLTETPENKSINFITGAGAFLQQVIYGYTGLRITDKGVIPKYKPMLPEGINKLTLKNFYANGKKYEIEVKDNMLTMKEIK